MAHEVPPLPYDYNALEPHIDEQTMRIHHDKHHQAYVDKANAALEGTEWADKPVEEVLKNLSSLPQDKQGPVRNNAGGHANHSLFWSVLGPSGGGVPSGDLGSAIDSTFGGFDALKKFAREAYERAESVIGSNRDALERVALALLEYEVLDGEEVATLVKGASVESLRAGRRPPTRPEAQPARVVEARPDRASAALGTDPIKQPS